jgi:hypothetical protein
VNDLEGFFQLFHQNQSITVKTNDKKPESLLRKVRFFLSSGKKLYLGGSLVLLAGLAVLLQQQLGGNQAAAISNPLKLTSLNGLPANERWGFDLDDYIMDDVELRPGDVLGEILMGQGMTYPQVSRAGGSVQRQVQHLFIQNRTKVALPDQGN